jgi:hypothetical protein
MDSQGERATDIGSVIARYQARCAQFVGPPGENGYSTQTLVSLVALLVEFQGRLETFSPADRASVAATLIELRQSLEEASYLAEFKMVRDEFVAAAKTESAGDSSMDLDESLARFEEFKRRFASFEGRAAELEAQGKPGLRKWLTPALGAADSQVARLQALLATNKTDRQKLVADSWLRFANLVPALERGVPATEAGADQRTIDEFNAASNAMNAAVQTIQAQIDASKENMWADRTPLYRSMYEEYGRFSSQLSRFEPMAKEMADRGKPELKAAIDNWTLESAKSCATIEQLLGARQANTMGLLGIAAGMQNAWQQHHDEMYKIQQNITDTINRHNCLLS